MGGESRASPRYALEAAIEVHSEGAETTGRTTNVSSGGLCAIVDRSVPRGQKVDVSISLVFAEDVFSEPLALPARVVWATELAPGQHQLGAQFLPLSDAQSHYLEMFLRYLAEADAAASAHEDDDEPFDDDPFA